MKEKDTGAAKAADQPKPAPEAPPAPKPALVTAPVAAAGGGRITPEEITEEVRRIGADLASDRNPEAVARAAERVCEFAERFSSLTGEQKEKLALETWDRLSAFVEPHLLAAIYNHIDEDEGTLDFITDPIAKMAARSAVPALLKVIGPGLVRLVCRATKGVTRVNRG